ncbi:MAG TPA: alpha/beta hydrolase-fold protein [Agriterribacter sp.]|nr:alpha/beta hydrolase-fold protein [Agriterribacter sp.]
MYKAFFFFFLVCMIQFQVVAQKDTSHFSRIFNTFKPYRIYLPADYGKSDVKYPVIYFFHGNKGSHKLALENVQQLVNKYRLILVAWNGRSVPDDERPYNTGYHSNIKYREQFKDYFPELVHHIDSAYHTIPDRSHRGVMGHSMGGFMSFFLAGKYPHLVGAAVNMKGSSEFFLGYPENHTLYLVKYMFMNFSGVKLRFHNSTVDELVYLNTEVYHGALREKGLDMDYRVYPGGHGYTYAEFKDAFLFIDSVFHHPNPPPLRWHHADLYPNFEIWGYQVNSTLHEPGFIELHGVTKGGMSIGTKKWQPDGLPVNGINISIKTPAIYNPNSTYRIFDFNPLSNSERITVAKSDEKGSIRFSVSNASSQIGIWDNRTPAEPVFLRYRVNGNSAFLDHKKECNLSVQLLNRGGTASGKLRVQLSSSTNDVMIANPVLDYQSVPSAGFSQTPAAFRVTFNGSPPADGSPPGVKFNLSVTDDKGNRWEDEFDTPVLYDVPVFDNIGIDDGDSEIFGSGNGNNVAEPGETIMIYQGSHRTRLFFDDPYIDNERLYDELQPDKWGDGYALSSLIHISKDCPPGHRIKFLACYEVKEWRSIKRNVTWGVFTITVGETKP